MRVEHRRFHRILLPILGVLAVCLYLFPLYWMVISGLKSQAEIFLTPPTYFPKEPTLDAFRAIMAGEQLLRYLRNSLSIAAPVAVLTVVLGAFGSYAMSRLRSRLVDIALVVILLLQVFPEALLATPIFIIFQQLNLLNTFTAVILATASKTVAFALVVLRPIFNQIPFEVEEAAAHVLTWVAIRQSTLILCPPPAASIQGRIEWTSCIGESWLTIPCASISLQSVCA